MLCALTGRRLTNENISPDHIIPISKGGTHDIGNIRLVDRDANIARAALSDEDFLKLCKDVVKTLDKGDEIGNVKNDQS